MLAECSGVAISIEVDAVPCPAGVPLERWLMSFPSYGYLLTAKPAKAASVLARFAERNLAAAVIGTVSTGREVAIVRQHEREVIWDFTASPLIGCALLEAVG
jgi:uncharacterized protein